MDIVSNEDASSKLTVVAATVATDDNDNILNVKLKLDGEHLIGHLNLPFPPEPNIPCLQSIILNAEPYGDNNAYGDNDDTCNDTVTNQADNNRPNEGERKSNILLSSLEVFVANEYGVICDRSDDDAPPPQPPDSLDDNVWNLERYRFNDDNNNFNYDDIDREILRFKYEDLIGESETIVFHDCNDVLDATQQENGNTKLEWTLKKY